MSQQFTRLLEPGRIGPVTTRNHIIKTANGTSFMDEDQTVGDRQIAYYESLARGGVGFLTVESCGVEYPLGIQHVHYAPDGTLIAGVQLHFDDDKFIPTYARLAAAIHKHGCPCSLQLQHAGAWNPTGLLPKRDTAVSSAFTKEELPGPDFSECRALTHSEVERQIDIWASAAERVFKAGFDAVEINHGTCHQGNTFLSRVWNKREDEYGAQNFENRTRFLRNCIAETKRRCGPGFAVTCLMNICEFRHPLATTIAEGVEMAALVAQVADGINCRAHSYGHRGGLIQPDRLLYPIYPDDLNDLPEGLDWSRQGKGATVPLVEAVKQKVKNIPIWTACRIDPDMGEEYLRKGSLDFVGMTRRLLADPELPNKLKSGHLEDIRWCHGCLYCFDCRNRNKRLECRVNAVLGREIDPKYMLTPAKTKKKVLVVGGGPGGMEAARVAAKRGHNVVLYEKQSHLGGLIPTAAIVKDLETDDLGIFVRYQETQLQKEGVSVHLKTEVTPDVIAREKPDVVIVSAGLAYTKFDIPGGTDPKVLTAAKLHQQLKFFAKIFSPMQIQKLTKLYMPVGKNVVVVGGKLHGCELAEFLVKRHRNVTMVHNGPKSELGEGMTVDDLENLWPWLKKKHVKILTDVKYERVTDKGLVVTDKDGKSVTLEADNIITTQDFAANTELFDKLKTMIPESYNIGSSSNPGLIVDAIRDGVEVGCAL
ncbi:MAG: FAD-dependent oxidoreductase [Candidatus Korobacteraceae bacterium]|jgi:2,4-dienoyl-CoA reductase (NADPH2)